MLNLIGFRVGKLTVVEKAAKPDNLKTKGTYWKAKCKCGNFTIVARSCLLGNHPTLSCGCIKSPNLIGRKFGSGKVIESCGRDARNNHVWLLLCKCGKTYEANTNRLTSKNTKSCGCIRSGRNSANYRGYEDITGDHWGIIKRNAASRKICFRITIKKAWEQFVKQAGRCALTNWKITLSSSGRKRANGLQQGEQTASLDRIDSTKGYVSGNIQWVHKDVNRMKSNFSEEYFLEMCRAIVKNDSINSCGI